MSSSALNNCFHCGDPLRGKVYSAQIDQVEQPMCCIGCQAAAELIQNAGMGDFYRQRTDTSNTANEFDESYWQQFDLAEERYLSVNGNSHSASIAVMGMYCSACSWLIERSYQGIAGIEDLSINLSHKRIRIDWNADRLKFSEVLVVLAKLGYQPQPLSSLDSSTHSQTENQSAMKRIAVAGLGMMQVMGYAFALYANEASGGMDTSTERFLNLISMVVTTAVVFYAGAPFFKNALRDLRSRHLGMDVPVALAIGTAYSSSVYNTLGNTGATVYFDSAVMFIFFLSLGRFLEMRIRHQALSSQEALSQLLPPLVTLSRQGETLNLPPQQLQRGDIIQLSSGKVAPCDGEIISGSGRFDESMLTGEAYSQQRNSGDKVIGGTTLCSGSVQLQASQMGQDSTLAKIGELLERAQGQRPRQTQLADRLARHFVLAVLSIASAVAVIWWFIDASQALAVVLSVLVVTCPCALSLATPAAITAACHGLSRQGIVVSNSNALETLNKVDHWCFDKTGTLTTGQMSLYKTQVTDKLSAEECLAIASQLEQQSSHPIAQAFVHADELETGLLSDWQEIAGNGVSGRIDNQHYYFGRCQWVAQQIDSPNTPDMDKEQGTAIALSNQEQVLAYFWVQDGLREQARQSIQQLNTPCSVLSGDRQSAVAATAEQLGIEHYRGELQPDDKVAAIEQLQQQHTVAMLGDGINDAPVLAKADVSISLACASQLAQSHADVLILNNQLSSLNIIVQTAVRCSRVIKQNLGWALLYNLSALPLAASGMLSPWMAALGMSLSSLLVVLNASRLNLRPQST